MHLFSFENLFCTVSCFVLFFIEEEGERRKGRRGGGEEEKEKKGRERGGLYSHVYSLM